MAIDRQTFLSQWFSECEGSIEIRVLPGGKQEFFSTDDYEGIEAFVSKHSSKNIYLGVATRNGAGGTKANIINIPGTWADIDFPSPKRKGIPKDKADKLLRECPLQPTFIIDSGNGYQPYWKFKEPTDNIQIVELINQQLSQYFESDRVHDVSRILRLPDTANHKYNPWRPVRVLIFNQGNQYNESDFEEHLPPVKDTAKAGEPSNPPRWQDEALKGVTSGSRHHTATKLIGRYIEKGLGDQEILPIIQNWDKGNSPSIQKDYGQGELLKIIQSIRKTDNRNHPPQQDPLQYPDVISGVAGEFARLYSQYLEVPESFFYMGYLACLGSILAKSLKLKTELETQVRIFLLLLGQSADERKSTAIKKTVQFFKELLRHDFSVCWGVNSAEGLQKVFKKNPTALMAIDELKQLLSKCKIEGSTLLPMITTLFESNIFEAHTKNSDIYIDNAHLSLIAASTIETYETVWHPSFTAIGFNNRIWIVPGAAKRQFSFPGKISDDKIDVVRQKTIKILRLVGEGLELDITPEARELFHTWYMGLEQSVHTKRLDGYALRFMGLLAVNDLKKEIDLETVEKAIALCDWQLKVRQLYDPIDADNAIAKMEERIRRYLRQEPLTDRELKRKLHRIIERSGVWCFTTAIKNLKVAKEIYFKRDGKKAFIYLSE